MDLTEHAGAKINRLGEACLKNNLITASNGSLVSTGEPGDSVHFTRRRTDSDCGGWNFESPKFYSDRFWGL